MDNNNLFRTCILSFDKAVPCNDNLHVKTTHLKQSVIVVLEIRGSARGFFHVRNTEERL